MKVYVVCAEYYDDCCGCFVSEIFHGVYKEEAEAMEFINEAVSANSALGIFDYVFYIKEVSL